MCCPGKVPRLLPHVFHAAGEGHGRLSYSHGPGAGSLICSRWQGVRGGRAYFSSPMPSHSRWEALAVLFPCFLDCLTCTASNMVGSIVLLGQGEAPALLSVATDGGSTNSPILVTLGPALPPLQVGEGKVIISSPTLPYGRGRVGPDLPRTSAALDCSPVKSMESAILPKLGTWLNLPSAAAVRDRVSSPTLVTLGPAFLAIIGDRRERGYLSPKPPHDRW